MNYSFLALMLTCLLPVTALALDSDQVFVTVDVNESAPSVTFTWDEQTDGVDIQVSRREIGQVGPAAWNPLATIAHPNVSYTDSSLQSGIAYEYKVYREYVSGDISWAASYIAVGVAAELVETRGRMLLLVEAGMGQALAPELAELEMDLVGDGWEVIRKDLPRDGDLHPDSVRAWIQRTDHRGECAAPVRIGRQRSRGRQRAVPDQRSSGARYARRQAAAIYLPSRSRLHRQRPFPGGRQRRRQSEHACYRRDHSRRHRAAELVFR